MIHLGIDLKVLMVAIPVGFITFRKNDPPYLKLLPFFLLFTLLVELTGELYQGPGRNNVILFNLFTVIEFLYYMYFFKVVIPGQKIKKVITRILYMLPLLCLVNIFFIQGPNVFHTYTYSLSCLVMVVMGITYFYQLFNHTTYVNLLREPAFWISIGIIFFFICSVSVIGVLNYVSTLPVKTSMLLQQLFLMVNAFFYILFIIAFLCKKNIRKSLPSS